MEDSRVIEIAVKLSPSEFRSLGLLRIILDNNATINDFYREAFYPMLSAIGFGTRTIIEGANDFYQEMKYLLEKEQTIDISNKSSDEIMSNTLDKV